MLLLKILTALVALLLMASVQAETNVTIDDTDPQIVYQPPGVWSFQGNVRPSFVQDRRHSLYYRRPSHRTDGIRRLIIHPNSGQQHLSLSLLGVLVLLPLGHC